MSSWLAKLGWTGLLKGCVSCGVLFLSTAAPAASAQSIVRIVEPEHDSILYGPTRITAAVRSDEPVARVAFFLDAYPKPLCLLEAPPYTCSFDAGREFQGRRLTVRAYGERERLLARDVVDTLAFPRPVQASANVLMVPVVAVSRSGDPPALSDETLRCELAGKPCRVRDARRLTAANDGVFIEILIDISLSVIVDRDEISDAVHAILDAAPEGTQIALTEFAGGYAHLGRFTADPEAVRESLERMSLNAPYTCLLDAMRRSLYQLDGLPGRKVLFVVTDGEETCEIRVFGTEEDSEVHIEGASVERTFKLSRQMGIPIYAYRVRGSGPSTWDPRHLAQEIARTGGRLFGEGPEGDLRHSVARLVGDLQSTWLVEIEPSEPGEEGRERPLKLELPDDPLAELLYPKGLTRGARGPALIAMLSSPDEEVRFAAASSLGNRPRSEALKPLVRAFRREPSVSVRMALLTAINLTTASLLLHGGAQEQKAALRAASELLDIHPVLARRLIPALKVFLRTGPPRRLLMRAERCLGQAERPRGSGLEG